MELITPSYFVVTANNLDKQTLLSDTEREDSNVYAAFSEKTDLINNLNVHLFNLINLPAEN